MGTKKKSRAKSVIIEKLTSYAEQNPRASDTAEGIARWWIKMPLEEVLPALERLVELGTWKKVKRDDRVLYGPIPNSECGKEL